MSGISIQIYRVCRFRNFGIWDTEKYFGILQISAWGMGYLYQFIFGIWDISYPLNNLMPDCSATGSNSDATRS